MEKKKKKGFTLIELIAVIAILAILGAIIVPKITGYSESAKKAKAISDAKTIVNAVAAYNADNEEDAAKQVGDDATIATAGASGISITAAVTTNSKTIEKMPTEFADTLTLTQLKSLASGGKGNVNIDKDGKVTPVK